MTPRKSPLTNDDQLKDASVVKLEKQMRFEVERLKEEHELTNEGLSLQLDYGNPSSVAKWASGNAPISKRGAEKLDEIGHKPLIGGSFVSLWAHYKRARRGVKPVRETDFDVFLASPMVSAKDYAKERKAAKDVKATLENWCGMSVFYAGEDRESEGDFDTPEMAAETNFEALRSSSFFVLLGLTLPKTPSSIFVEAGFALARDVPSLYLTPSHEKLPFILQTLGQHNHINLPAVMVEFVRTGDDAVALLKRNGGAIFDRLEQRPNR